ncbi:MAG: hypothetical protein V1775_16770 [Bacteroidota bacterium]
MDLFYKISLLLHSWNRYSILIGGIIVIVFALKGLKSGTPYRNADRKSMLFFVSSLHFQLFIGLILYFFVSPVTTLALNDFGAAMKDSTMRFWAVEHAFVNIIAVAAAQTGSILVKRKLPDHNKHKRALIWTSVALLLIIAMIPMGIMGVDRPWFRF